MTRPAVSDHDVSVSGATIHVRRVFARPGTSRAGRPTIVFLHDSLGCIETWRDFPQLLASRVSLDAAIYDRQGYGSSSPFGSAPRTPQYLEEEAHVLRLLLDTLDIESAVLFGHSDGGSIALIGAALEPDRIAAVITEGAHVFVEDVTLRGIRAARDAFATTDLAARLTRYHGDKVPAIGSAWIDTWLSPSFRSWNIEHFLSRVRCPVLVMQGEDDEYGTVAQVHAIAQGAKPHAEALLIPGVGHTPHRDAQDTVLEAAADFIENTLRNPFREAARGSDPNAADARG